MLSEEQIAKFQAIYRKCFGEEISKDEASKRGTKLIQLIELIYKPIEDKSKKKEELKKEH
jgi:hypothetical protein